MLQVLDPLLEDLGGRYLLEVEDGTATCGRTDQDVDLTLSVADLGSSCLGGGSLRRLVRAGRVQEHTTGAAALADTWFVVDPLPWCWVRF